MKRILCLRKAFLLLFVLLFFQSIAYCAQKQEVIVFHSSGCHGCVKAKQEIIPAIEAEFKSKISFSYYDFDLVENYKLLFGLKEKYDPQLHISLPVFFMNGKFLTGQNLTRESLREFLSQALALAPVAPASLKNIDLTQRFKTIVPVAVVGAGLIDGINPCAFTVIVFFMSFLALQGYRRRDLVIIGLAFIFAVFITYFLIGLGLFGFLYKLAGFWVIVKVINYSIGIFSLVLGFLSIYDLVKFNKSGNTEGMILQLPASVKQQIHRVIGLHYRVTKGQSSEKPKYLFKLIISALISGFLVSLLEAVCTGQTYLPTITFVFKSCGNFRLQALLYLVLYNLMFIFPLFVIFIFAVFGVTSEQFSKFLKKHMPLIKVLMAALFFILGVLLIWRA
ncbi:MAG: hypothetical protein NTY47_06830 [Candidatus Omnitrophica bacterium]|nr:hypothetical protein [Candidatus Omnitrophota bacterium]